MSKVAVVTGGAHPMGIGFASARALARDGYEVVVTGLTEAETKLTPDVAGIRSAVLDVSNDEAVEVFFAGFERLDALVNCAGMASQSEFEPKAFMRTLDVNLGGSLRAAVAAYPLLVKTQGCIVNIASMHGYRGNPAIPGYSASKTGVHGLTRSLACAWGKDNIRVNAVAPGYIKTEMARGVWENPEYAHEVITHTPMGRFGEPEECGDVIAFLCSPGARFVSGITVPVDGGHLAL